MEENIEILEGFIGRLNQDVYFDETTSFEYLKQPLENVLKELETYKKIAELMADFINMYTLSGEEHHYCHKTMSCAVVGGSRSCIDCILDWARKEVENEI